MKVGFIGLGLMGNPMAKRLVNAGYNLVVYNRTKEKANEILELGAVWAGNPLEVSKRSDVVVSMISTPEVLREVALGDNGILKGLSEGKIHIDMSTVSPEVIKELNEVYTKNKIHFLHAPVLGSVTNVIDGSLLIFVGGDENAYLKCKGIFEALGKRIWYFKKHTQATHMKLACNQFIANMIVALSQGFVLVKKCGIEPEILLDILSESTLNSPMYQFKGRTIIEQNFEPRFPAEHLLKDINLVIGAAEKLDINLPTLPIMKNLFDKCVHEGMGRLDYSSIFKIIASDKFCL